MKKGYQILEPEVLDDFIKSGIELEQKVFVLNKIINILQETLNMDEYKNFNIEVINVSYRGSYPAIGLQYNSGENNEDYGVNIENHINDIVNSDYISNLIKLT